MADFEVVICGGGIAGVEGLLRLRRLTGERIGTTLVSPDEELVYRPLAVREPFAMAGIRRYPLERIVRDTGSEWIRDRLGWVDRAARKVVTEGGAELGYDALLLAVGARESSPYEHAQVFTDRNADEAFHGIVQDVEMGYVGSVGFVMPDGPAWPVPLYELALMMAERAHAMDVEPELQFVTPEPHPLAAFGGGAGEAVARLLREAGITLHTGETARIPAPGQLEVGQDQLRLDRIVTIPKIVGPAVQGVPAAHDRFVPVDEHCLVPATDGRVFAAGDATDLPVKHGGIGSQQADTAAAGIAHLAGIGEAPGPLHPVIRGMLLTGEHPLYLAAHVIAGRGWHSEIYEQPPWPAEDKIVAEELGTYLRGIGDEDRS